MNASFGETATGLPISGLELGIESNEHGGLEIREWNTLIGIVTAIVGNVLISFALNIQRYAHIRLNNDRHRRQKPSVDGKGKSYGAVDYSTEQARIAAERAKLNLNAPSEGERDAEYNDSYPRIGGDGQSARSRSSSASTVRQEKNQEEAAPSTTYLKSPYWWAGILLMTTGEAGNFLAYGFAPASIVSPLGVVALISNCIIAPWLLKERFRQRDFWGVLVAVGGAVTVVLSAKTSETKMGPHDVWVAITRWEFEFYMGVTAALMVTLMWASGRYGERTILIDLGLVGLFGAYTALSTKGIASLISASLWRAPTFPITYLLVFVLVATALLQIRYVNRALQRFDSTQVIPTQFVLFTLSVIIGSAVLYREFESATLDRVLKFIGGCALTFLGVYLITSGRSGEESSEDEDAENVDQPIILVDEEERHDETAAGHDENMGKRRASAAITFYEGAHRHSNSRRTSYHRSSGQQSLPQTPRRFNSNVSSNLSPLTTPGPDSPLLENPWTSSQDRHRLRQSFQTTASSPVLPSEAQETRPSTSRELSHQHHLPPRTERPATLTRKSIARMLPGPLVSPLSNPLSAIVADNLRRGMDSPTRMRRRRGLSTLRLSRSQRTTSGTLDEETGLLTPVALDGRESSQESISEEASSHGKRRSKSVSMSVGDFFGFHRGKSKRADGDTTDAGQATSASEG